MSTLACNVRVFTGRVLTALVFMGITVIGGSFIPAAVRAAEATGYSASALYNLGNAYARDGKPGMAVLQYERASLLAPNDPDIEANLNFERRAAHRPTEPPSLFTRSARRIDPSILAWVGLLGIALVGCALVVGRLPSLKWRTPTIRFTLIAVGSALLAATLCNAVLLWPLTHAAIVITNAAPVRVSPVPMGDVLFTLSEADTVRIRAAHEGFLLIRTDAGKTGWVSQNSVVPVVPTATRTTRDHAPR